MISETVQYDDILDITIHPAMNGRLRVTVDRNFPFDRARIVHAVTVHGDGRIDYHDEADRHDDAITNAWMSELVKAARDAHQPGPCLLEGGSCIAHDWHGEGRCPHARIGDILVALDGTPKETT